MRLYLNITSKFYYEYFCCVNNGNLLVLKKSDVILNKIKFMLDLAPNKFEKINNENTIILELPAQVYHKRKLLYNTAYRNHFSNIAETIINRELYLDFKNKFHSFVSAYYNNDLSQKKGILDFCDLYNLNLDNINFEMLKKSWDRSEMKELIKKQKKI